LNAQPATRNNFVSEFSPNEFGAQKFVINHWLKPVAWGEKISEHRTRHHALRTIFMHACTHARLHACTQDHRWRKNWAPTL